MVSIIPTLPAGSRILHVADVEGDLGFFKRWVAHSAGICFDDNGALALEPNTYMVFGGDALDGPDDVAFLSLLIEVKQRYPARVFLIAGNRDLCKTRLKTELNAAHIAYMGHCAAVAPWYRSYTEVYAYPDFCVHTQQDPHNPIAYLKWFLSQTCNAKSAFEDWKRALSKAAGDVVSDMVVYQAFADAVLPEGIISRYLAHTDLVVRLGENIFVHGALTPQSWDWMEMGPEDSVDAWITQVNATYHQHLRDWQAASPAQSAQHDTPQQPLVRMALKVDQNGGHTVITSNWHRGDRYQAPPPVQVDWLYRHGVYRVITGHQPWGDYPVLLAAPGDQPLQVLMNDTRYSGVSGRSPHAVQSLQIIKGSDGSSYAYVTGTRHDHSPLVQHYPALTAQGQWTAEMHSSPLRLLGRYIHHPHPPQTIPDLPWLVGLYDAGVYAITARQKFSVFHDYLPEKTVMQIATTQKGTR